MSGDFETTLNYCVPASPGEPLIKYVFDPPPGVPKQNFELHPFPVTVRDLRGANADVEKIASLDAQAFQFVKHTSKEQDFDDEERITTEYYDEVEQLVKDNVPGAKRVVIFDHTLR